MAATSDVFVVDAARTPTGRRQGALAKVHPADLAAHVLDALCARNPKSVLAQVDDVLLGCVTKVGAQSFNIARSAVLASSHLPESVPASTVDRLCGSSLQAITFATHAIAANQADVLIAGGVENMSMVPIGTDNNTPQELAGKPFNSVGIQHKYGDNVNFSQFVGADLLAERYHITRDEIDRYAAESHRRAAAAMARGAHAGPEIVALENVATVDGKTAKLVVDETVRPGTTAAKLGKLRVLRDGGKHSAGSASQVSDGACALLLASGRTVNKLHAKPLARIVAVAAIGSDPVVMLGGPAPATVRVLERARLHLRDIDVFEVNEAFASVPLAWKCEMVKTYGVTESWIMERLNPNGGAIALGHPLGATGAKLVTSMLYHLRATGGRRGLVAVCEGGGTANAAIFEMVDEAAERSRL